MSATPASMKNVLAKLEYEYDEDSLRTMISLLAGAHGHRIDVGNTKETGVTRSTALAVFNHLNPTIGTILRAAGLDWEGYCKKIALDGPITSKNVEDVELHEDFERSLTLFRDSHPDTRTPTPENLSLAIIEMAVMDPTGRVGQRLTKEGADLSLALQKLFEAFNAGQSEDAVETPTSVPDAAQEIVFIDDAPKTDEDFLNRGDLAFVLAARLNRAWDETNAESKGSDGPKQGFRAAEWIRRLFDKLVRSSVFRGRKQGSFESSFVVHIDAPWGGGKTTFANYLSRILNPYRIAGTPPDWLARLPLHDERFWPTEFRRPWHTVSFNAWQHQHVDPPWWCFYQSIRRQCFHAVRTETFAATPIPPRDTPQGGGQSEGKIPPKPSQRFRYRGLFRRHLKWLDLWCRELSWRIFNPKVRTLVITFILTLLAALILYKNGLFDLNKVKTALSGAPQNGIDLRAVVTTGIVILFGGTTAIWSVFASFTDSLLPGTSDAAKNYSLGSGDPLERFRTHFQKIIRRLERPVLVVIDDIDRCEPRFVVELLRGIQTILSSSHVIFLLLGDRNWIEHAFTNIHEAMAGIDVGPEHGFGGRFVEKAIQLSLVLPNITHDGRKDYVQRLLGVAHKASQQGTEALPETERRAVEESLDEILNTSDPMSRDVKARSLQKSLDTDETLDEASRMAVVKGIDRQLALRSVADHRLQEATRHRLVPIAPVLPANPRQIKRIINSIALYQEIARIEQQIRPGSPDWCKLVIWVVIMTEWPKTWATLCTYPGLVDRLRKPGEAPAGVLPDGEVTDKWLEAIQGNKPIMDLLKFSSKEGYWSGGLIDATAIEQFKQFMPAAGAELLPE